MARIDGVPIWIGPAGDAIELQRVELSPSSKSEFDENWLQRLVHRHPEMLPMSQLESGFAKLSSVCMELPTKHGPVDNLLMTGDGDIVIVEAKLWRNSESRRTVVAQALDYASCLFEMNYEEFQSAALKGDFAGQPKLKTLYDALANAESLIEADFVDAVSRNLRNGRIVVLVVGDGIRSEMERLSAALQSHGGFHFTFALVELAVFHLPDHSGYMVQPRTLAMTTMIERGIVRIDDQRAKVVAVEPSQIIAQNITAEQFLDAMTKRGKNVPNKLKSFLASLEQIGVYPDYRRSLILRWEAPNGKSVNLGSIYRDGLVWTEAVNSTVPIELAHRYNEELAAVMGMEVEKTKLGDNWHIRRNGKIPKIENVMERFDDWVAVIERLINDVRKNLSQGGNS